MFRKFLPCAVVSLVLGCFILGLSGCADTSDQLPAFSGKWNQLIENMVNGDKEAISFTVISDGKRFRVESSNEITVYDGTSLWTKYTGEYASSEPSRSDISEVGAKQEMFWRNTLFNKKGAGGSVAGRNTTLFQAASNRPDGEIAIQNWVDSEKKIVLKSLKTIIRNGRRLH